MQLSDNPDEICFGRFRVDPQRRRLLHDGEPVELSGRALDILRLLASAEGAVVSKDELMTGLWPGQAVAENNLHVHISALRKALDISATRMIATSSPYQAVGIGWRI